MNVELCTSTNVIKYLFDYIFKGVDKISTTLVDKNGNVAHDEIQEYVDNYYICAYESVWNLLKYPQHERYPAVERLPVHDLGEHWVSYSREDSDNEFLGKLKKAQTHDPLQGYFDTNALEYEYRNKIQELYPKRGYLYKKDGSKKPLAKGIIYLHTTYLFLPVFIIHFHAYL